MIKFDDHNRVYWVIARRLPNGEDALPLLRERWHFEPGPVQTDDTISVYSPMRWDISFPRRGTGWDAQIRDYRHRLIITVHRSGNLSSWHLQLSA